MQSKMYKLFTSGIFHLIFLDQGWLPLTKATDNRTTGKDNFIEKLFKGKALLPPLYQGIQIEPYCSVCSYDLKAHLGPGLHA